MRLPDFIIAGAPRSATTWLYHVLARHPSIYLAQPLRPEPKFFLVDETYEKGLKHYSDTWFKNAPATAVAGEKSTNYLESRQAAERIARDLPRVKLVFILRNPTDRAVSNYFWSRKNGMETLGIREAFAAEEERERTLDPKLRYARPHAYFSRGLYADLLEPYFRLVGPARIHLIVQEELLASPATTLGGLYRFLDVPVRPSDYAELEVINSAPREEVARSFLAELDERYRAPNEKLTRLMGRAISAWRGSGEAVA